MSEARVQYLLAGTSLCIEIVLLVVCSALLVMLTGPARAGLGLGLGDAIGSALRKLVAALPDQQRPGAELASRRILIDPVRWRGSAQPSDRLEVLQEASFSGRRVKLRYRHGRNGSVRTYTLDPYGLVSKAGVWYLAADPWRDCRASSEGDAPWKCFLYRTTRRRRR